MDAQLSEKYSTLEAIIREMGSVVVAFSGGVDSALLAYTVHKVLGERMLACTVKQHSTATSELQDAKDFCARYAIPHRVIEQNELEIPGFAENPQNRCYLCKTSILITLKRIADDEGFAFIAEGSNCDDTGDYRPGMQAIREQEARSPLLEAGFSKDDIRALSHELNLPTWNKPQAACLSSRIPYGLEISEQRLRTIDAAEAYLHELGFKELRVRVHNDIARIELAQEDLTLALQEDMRVLISKRLHELGFSYVTLDLDGFRSGSMNEVL